jgi:hypothetical protein
VGHAEWDRLDNAAKKECKESAFPIFLERGEENMEHVLPRRLAIIACAVVVLNWLILAALLLIPGIRRTIVNLLHLCVQPSGETAGADFRCRCTGLTSSKAGYASA